MQIGDVVCEPKEFLLKTVFIGQPDAPFQPDDPSRASDLAAALERTRLVPSKVYTTYVPHGSRTFVLSTGSKDIHLRLGYMQRDGLAALVDCIDHETQIDHELLLVLPEGNGRGLICTKHTSREGVVKITLQVAND